MIVLALPRGDRLGVRFPIDEHVPLGKVTGAANSGQNGMTVVAALVD